MVTAELALALPALVLVLGFALTAQLVVAARAACLDAARSAVRVAARGESDADAAAAAHRASARVTSVKVVRGDGLVRVEVRGRPGSVVAVLPGLEVRAAAVAVDETVP